MENTIENKIKFFTKYIGENILIEQENPEPRIKKLTYLEFIHSNTKKQFIPGSFIGVDLLIPRTSVLEKDGIYLLLAKPTEMTESDLLEIYSEIGRASFTPADFNFCHYQYSLPHVVTIIDSVRARGYAVEYNIHKYVEYGWVKLMDINTIKGFNTSND